MFSAFILLFLSPCLWSDPSLSFLPYTIHASPPPATPQTHLPLPRRAGPPAHLLYMKSFWHSLKKEARNQLHRSQLSGHEDYTVYRTHTDTQESVSIRSGIPRCCTQGHAFSWRRRNTRKWSPDNFHSSRQYGSVAKRMDHKAQLPESKSASSLASCVSYATFFIIWCFSSFFCKLAKIALPPQDSREK